MTDSKMLKAAIKRSGVSISFLSREMQCSRNRIYSIINGADCTATEIARLTELLHLTLEERDDIFLSQNVSVAHVS